MKQLEKLELYSRVKLFLLLDSSSMENFTTRRSLLFREYKHPWTSMVETLHESMAGNVLFTDYLTYPVSYVVLLGTFEKEMWHAHIHLLLTLLHFNPSGASLCPLLEFHLVRQTPKSCTFVLFGSTAPDCVAQQLHGLKPHSSNGLFVLDRAVKRLPDPADCYQVRRKLSRPVHEGSIMIVVLR